MTRKAWLCWLPELPEATGVVFAPSAGKARYIAALSAHDAGCIPRASPHRIHCRRSPDLDSHPLSLAPPRCWVPSLLQSSPR